MNNYKIQYTTGYGGWDGSPGGKDEPITFPLEKLGVKQDLCDLTPGNTGFLNAYREYGRSGALIFGVQLLDGDDNPVAEINLHKIDARSNWTPNLRDAIIAGLADGSIKVKNYAVRDNPPKDHPCQIYTDKKGNIEMVG